VEGGDGFANGWLDGGRREPRGRRCALARTTSRYVTDTTENPPKGSTRNKGRTSPALSAAPADTHTHIYIYIYIYPSSSSPLPLPLPPSPVRAGERTFVPSAASPPAPLSLSFYSLISCRARCLPPPPLRFRSVSRVT